MLKPRPGIAALALYQSPISTRTGLNLDLNENLVGCSPRVLERLRTLSMDEISRYPQRECGERLMAEFLRVAPEQVLLTNGVDDALTMMFATYLSENSELLITDPTFVMYPMLGQAFGARIVAVPCRASFEFPADEVLSCISDRTRVIAIANPNNPTGTVARAEDLLRIINAGPDSAVLIDEAYFDFYGETLLPEIAHYPNLFVSRTFSKAYGLAGLRLGALVAAREPISEIRALCPPFNVNAAALACLESALSDQAFVQEYVAQIKEGRDQIGKLCAELGIECYPSSASYVFVRVGTNSAAFVEAMQRRGIIVRDFSGGPNCNGCVRITVPGRTQIDRLLRALPEAIQS